MDYLSYALKQDDLDRLKEFKKQFHCPDGSRYFVGNSLGLLSESAEQSLEEVLIEWKDHGIGGWLSDNPWYYFSEKLSEKFAPFLGADKSEIILTGSITSNLHQAIATFYQPTSKRFKIVTDELSFPTDMYVLQSQMQHHNVDLEKGLKKIKSHDGFLLTEEDIFKSIKDDVAILFLPSVIYTSGQLLNIKKIVEYAHAKGVTVGFDLAHSVGVIPHQLHEWGVDFAVWCNYKYINGGPGAVGGLFIHERHHEKEPAFKGWFGCDKQQQFNMSHTFYKAKGAGGFQLGTPHILSLAPLKGSLELLEQAGIENIRLKSMKITDYMVDIIKELIPELTIVSPLLANNRGGHIAITHDEAYRISKIMRDYKVIVDCRGNIIRLSPHPLYCSFREVWEVVNLLQRIIDEELYLKYEKKLDIIT
ncbi:kynureninase [Bacillus carboniphilus]|uniref:Kynureninase n=1 Tax=Bacillus carboniphilus TaxID=86663 RepID=A0ABY9JW82_9BACI|nr:kynureninase [Bacillus carboniphilus]WLR43028.1 kynureninase [Bacillus carboniphilus]